MLSHLPCQASSNQPILFRLDFAPKEGAIYRVFLKLRACQVGIEEQVVGISGEEDISITGDTFANSLLTVSRAARDEPREEVP